MEKLMTSEEVAEILHVDPVTIRRLISRGDLSAYRIGADYRISPMDLANYLQRQRVEANAEISDPNGPVEQFVNWLRQKSSVVSPTAVRDRFDKFTDEARHVLGLAQEEALSFQHNYIGTEHLLLGLLREEEGTAAQVLNKLGIELEKVRKAVEFIIGRGDLVVLNEVGLTPRSKKVIELAVDEARRMQHRYLGTEHILLGLIREGEGIAAGILTSMGLKLGQVREETIATLQRQQQKAAEEMEKTLQTPTDQEKEAEEPALQQEPDETIKGDEDSPPPSTDDDPQTDNK